MLPGGVFNTKYQLDLAILRTRLQWLLLGLGLVAAFTVPLYVSSYWLGQLTGLAVTIVAVLGLHVLTGLCGQISIGHAAFMGVGAYTVGILATNYGVNGWLCLPICALSAGVVGLVFGLPSFRLKGFYLAVSTLAASFIIVWCIKHFDSFTGGYRYKSVEPLSIGGMEFYSNAAFYSLVFLLLLLATYFAKNIQRTAAGRAFVAIRDNELAAEVNGINIFRYKMLAFFIGCAFAGVAGWLWTYQQTTITPGDFQISESLRYIGVLIVGGWGSTAGVFLGATFLWFLDVMIKDQIVPALIETFPSWAGQLPYMGAIVLGVVVIAFVLLEPRGLAYRWEKIKTYYRLHPYSFWETQ
jgi:branched-chain amino acid transport system permease protein